MKQIVLTYCNADDVETSITVKRFTYKQLYAFNELYDVFIKKMYEFNFSIGSYLVADKENYNLLLQILETIPTSQGIGIDIEDVVNDFDFLTNLLVMEEQINSEGRSEPVSKSVIFQLNNLDWDSKIQEYQEEKKKLALR